MATERDATCDGMGASERNVRELKRAAGGLGRKNRELPTATEACQDRRLKIKSPGGKRGEATIKYNGPGKYASVFVHGSEAVSAGSNKCNLN
jgi:hypothetical protein